VFRFTMSYKYDDFVDQTEPFSSPASMLTPPVFTNSELDQDLTRYDLTHPNDSNNITVGENSTASSPVMSSQDRRLEHANVFVVLDNPSPEDVRLVMNQDSTQAGWEKRFDGSGVHLYESMHTGQDWVRGGGAQIPPLSWGQPANSNSSSPPPWDQKSYGNFGQGLGAMDFPEGDRLNRYEGDEGDEGDDGESHEGPSSFDRTQLELLWTGPTPCYLEGCRHDRLFQTLQTWRSHVKNVHKKYLLCDEPGCSYTRPFASNTDVKRHFETKHDLTKQFKCDRSLCKRKVRAWSRKDKLKLHNTKWHSNVRCFLCSESLRHQVWFDTVTELWDHTKSDHCE